MRITAESEKPPFDRPKCPSRGHGLVHEREQQAFGLFKISVGARCGALNVDGSGDGGHCGSDNGQMANPKFPPTTGQNL